MDTHTELKDLLGESATKKLLSLRILWELEGLSSHETDQQLQELRESLQGAFDQTVAKMKQLIEMDLSQIIKLCQYLERVSQELQISPPTCNETLSLSSVKTQARQTLNELNESNFDLYDKSSKQKISKMGSFQSIREALEIIQQMEQEWTQRRQEKINKIEEKRQKVVHLWVDVLGEALDDLEDPFREEEDIASSEREVQMDEKYKTLCQEVEQRKHKVIESLQKICAHLESLQIDNEEDMEDEIDHLAFQLRNIDANGSNVYQHLDVTRYRMDIIVAREEALLQEVQRRFQQLQNFMSQLSFYYEKLKFSMEEYEEFASKHSDLSLSCLKAWENELRRLEELEKERLQQLLDESKQKLHSLWNELQVPVSERVHWQEALDKQHLGSEQMIAKYDEEINRLESFAEKVRPIYQLFERRQEIIQKREAFLKETQDPSRLFGRSQDGSRRDATFLLREERLRKEIEKLPKIQESLKKRIREFEASVNQTFLWDGEPLLEKLLEEERREQQEKIEQRKRREAERRARLEVEAKYGTNATPELLRKVQASAKKAASKQNNNGLQEKENQRGGHRAQHHLGLPTTPSSSKSNSTRSTSWSDRNGHTLPRTLSRPEGAGLTDFYHHTPSKDENQYKKQQEYPASQCHSPLSVTSKTSVSRQHTFLATSQEDSGESVNNGEVDKQSSQFQRELDMYSSVTQQQPAFRLPGVPVSSKICGYSKNSFKSSSSSSHSELATQHTYSNHLKTVKDIEENMVKGMADEKYEENDENRRPYTYQSTVSHVYSEIPSFVREVVSVDEAEDSKFTCTESPINTTSTTAEGMQ
eukprot:jgi/Galph1/3438/GphlegSOOS_G2066.1